MEQAERQVAAAKGLRIEWHFAEEEAANVVRQLFQNENINIQVFYTPYIKP
ncbi:hypothetical protein SIO70_17525 [Chitinophaga sancti]|uniref:hypothetical protein n=1 Tax=Chitinophaga sancti TaxID=1004 RepID=UPI002A7500EB|nr:hypothetical protein [Chitinophaga sancti]WPQ60144.1 hypothetical protein SIO70_17525 [Chitinophaga sancti]